MTLRLAEPCHELVPGYIAAMKNGWSPNSERDVIADELIDLARDEAASLRRFTHGEGTVKLADGRVVARLPGRYFWIDDGEFCGQINVRYVPGTEDLPDHVSGHAGYSIVPWKRRRGYATRALAMLLPYAAEAGLGRILLTCDDDNIASRAVIVANGGIAAGSSPHLSRPGVRKLHFWVATSGVQNL